MGFKEGNRLAPRYYQDPVTGDKVSYEEFMDWSEDQECVDPWELRAYCKGCRDYGPTVCLSRLDWIINVPGDQRIVVGALIRDSVGCPMSGKSHKDVQLEWRQMND